ncbi:MAG: hypothetical protein AB1779_04515 [Candidatus Thermoplasmatota archaeon]
MIGVGEAEMKKLEFKRKTKLVYLVEVIILLLIPTAVFFIFYEKEPLFIPIVSVLLTFFLASFIILILNVIFIKRKKILLGDAYDRFLLFSNYMATCVGLIVVTVLFLALLLSLFIPQTNWVEQAASQGKEHTMDGTFGEPSLLYMSKVYIKFMGDPPTDIVHTSVHVKAEKEIIYYVFTKEEFEELTVILERWQNATINESDVPQLQRALAHGENVTEFEFSGKKLKFEYYYLWILNPNNETVKINGFVKRGIDRGAVLSFIIVDIMFLFSTIFWLTYLFRFKKELKKPEYAPAEIPVAEPLPQPKLEISGEQVTLKCPGCKTPFNALRKAERTRIVCPTCGKEGYLSPKVKEKTLRCPTCKMTFNVKDDGKRPLPIKCSYCGKEGVMR